MSFDAFISVPFRTSGVAPVVPDPPFDFVDGVEFSSAGAAGGLATAGNVGYTTAYDLAVWIKPTAPWVGGSGNKSIVQLGSNSGGLSHILGHSNTGELLVIQFGSPFVVHNTDVMLVEGLEYLIRMQYSAGKIQLSVNGDNVADPITIGPIQDAAMILGGAKNHISGSYLAGFQPSVSIGHLAIGTSLTMDAKKPNVPPTGANAMGADLVYNFNAGSLVDDVAPSIPLTVEGSYTVAVDSDWDVDDVEDYYRIVGLGDSFIAGTVMSLGGIRTSLYDATDGAAYNFLMDGIISDNDNVVGTPDLHEGTAGFTVQQIHDYSIGVWMGGYDPLGPGSPGVGNLGHVEQLMNRSQHKMTFVMMLGYNDAILAGGINMALMVAAADTIADNIRRIDEVVKLYPGAEAPRFVLCNTTPNFGDANADANGVHLNTALAARVPTLVGEGRDVVLVDARSVITSNTTHTVDDLHLSPAGNNAVVALLLPEITAP